MIGLPTPLIGMAGLVLLAASLTPGQLGSSPNPPGRGNALQINLVSGSKADRLLSPPKSAERVVVSSIELLEGARTTLTFRDSDGNVLFRSDPIAGITAVAKNVDLPVVSVEPAPRREEPGSGAREQSEPPTNTKRQRRPAGCESTVSSLVRGHDAAPGLCLAGLEATGQRS